MFGQGQLVFMAGGIVLGYVLHPAIAKILAMLGHKATVAAPATPPAPPKTTTEGSA